MRLGIRRRLVALALGLLAQVPATVFAQDSGLQRLSLRSEGLGWEAVGRLDLGASGFCSGVLIAPDLVLTAAHCLIERDTGVIRALSDLRFRAGLRDGLAVAERGIDRAAVHPVFIDPATPRDGQIRHDLALLHLAAPIPAAIAAPYAVRRLPAAGATVSVVSYGAGRAEALSWQRRCAILETQDRLAMLSCEATFGASGAPVFDLAGPRARIVAIVSSGGRHGEHEVAFGMELPSLLADLKAGLRSGRGVMEAARDGLARRAPKANHTASGARFLKVKTNGQGS